MIIDWIYNNPTWLWGTILVVLVTSIASGGLLVFHRLVHVSLRRAHNDLAGFTIAIISVLYAVLLAFIAIATWESFSKASDIVENESDYVGGMYLDTAGLPDAKGQEIRDALEKYVSVVIDQEWPIQREGKTPTQGWKPLRDLATAIATIHPQNSGETVIEAELLKSWNQVYDARSARLSAVQGHIPGVIWCIVCFGAAITIAYTYLFGFESFGMHMAMTATVAATLALVIVMIIALDWPFRGQISVSPDPFIMTQQSWADAPLYKK
jgi:Protein of unknown function (DUF4239)